MKTLSAPTVPAQKSVCHRWTSVRGNVWVCIRKDCDGKRHVFCSCAR